MSWRVRLADCIEAMREMDEASVDAIVTDPPYGLEFMGKEWDRLAGVEPTRTSAGGGTPEGRTEGLPNGYAGARVRYGQRASQEWHQAWATEALRVLKPGGHLLAFGGTRTYHRLACAVEDAGFEIRDSVIWLYGSGFPKSLDVGKAIDKRPGAGSHAAFVRHLVEQRQAKELSRADVSEAVVGTRSGACWNWEHHQFPEYKWWPKLRDLLDLDPKWEPVLAEAEREKVGKGTSGKTAIWAEGGMGDFDLTTPATPEAQHWQGFGTALKPSHEPVVVARKPLVGTVAQNCLEFGTGALNIDASRIQHQSEADKASATPQGRATGKSGALAGKTQHDGERSEFERPDTSQGRWPANVALSHLPECEPVGTRRVKGSDRPNRGGEDHESPGGFLGDKQIMHSAAQHADPDGLETVTAWECAENCPVRELDRQSGETQSSDRAKYVGNQYGGSDTPTEGGFTEGHQGLGYNDTGGGSRFFLSVQGYRVEECAGLVSDAELHSMRSQVPSSEATGGSALDAADTRHESLTEGSRTLGDTSERQMGAGIGSGANPEVEASSPKSNLGGSGSENTDQSPKGGKSTTGTGTKRTTPSTTSSSSKRERTTTSTSESERITESGAESRSGGASGATPTSHSTPSTSDEPGPSAVIAKGVPPPTSESGEPRIESIGTPTTAPIERETEPEWGVCEGCGRGGEIWAGGRSFCRKCRLADVGSGGEQPQTGTSQATADVSARFRYEAKASRAERTAGVGANAHPT